MKALKVTFSPSSPYLFMVGTGGIGSGIFFELDGDQTLGRNESRAGRLLDWKDYCKLHIVFHYVSIFLGADPKGKGFRVLPIGKVGDDDAGREMLRYMADAGMDISYVKMLPGVKTLFSVCFQYPSGAAGNITSSNSASSLVTPKDIQEAEPLFAEYQGKGIAVALPEVPLETRKRLLELATAYEFFRVASFTSIETKKVARTGMMEEIDLVALNEDEAKVIANVSGEGKMSEKVLDRCAAVLTRHNPDIKIAVTLGSKGAYGYESGRWGYSPQFVVESINTAGAGDAYLSGLIISIVAGLPFIRKDLGSTQSRGLSIETGMDFAALLASLKVTSTDTIHMRADAQSLYEHAVHLGARLSPEMSRLFDKTE